MHRRLKLHLLVLLIPALLLACNGEEGGGASSSPSGSPDSSPRTPPDSPIVAGVAAVPAPEDELSLLCPDGAMVFIRFNDLNRVEQEVFNLAQSADPSDESAVMLTEQIGAAFGNPKMKGVDLERPLGVALFNSGAGGPLPAFIIPVSSEQAFRSALEADPSWVHMKDSVGLSFVGKWAIFSMDPGLNEGFTLRAAPGALAAGMLAGDVSLTVDLAAINEMVAPELDQMLESGTELPPEMAQLGGFFESYLEAMKGFLADSETLHVSATMRNGDMSFTVKYGARSGSKTGNALSAAVPEKPTLIQSLGTAGVFAAEFHMSMEGLWDLYAPFYESILAEDEELLVFMKKGFTAMDGGAFGVSIRNGMKMVALTHLTDPEGYREYYAEMMSRMSEFQDKMKEAPGMEDMGMTFEMLPGYQHDDVAVSTMKVGMDFSGIPDLPPQASMFMDQFFGPDGMHIQTCVVGELGISTVGDQDMKAMIDRVKAGGSSPMPAVYADATAGFPETVNGIFYMNFGEIAPWVADLAKEEINPEQSALLTNPPPDLWCAGYIRTDGPTVTFGMNMKLGQMVKYIGAIMQSE